MSSQNGFVPPPRLAGWLVDLFASAKEADSVAGDLAEEFSTIARTSGVAEARHWFWRQTAKTIAYLIKAQLRSGLWVIAAAAIGGFLGRWYFSRLTNPLVQQTIEAVLDRYRLYDQNVQTYLFLYNNSMMLERLLVNALLGVLIAWAARGRELTATIVLALLGDVLAIEAVITGFAQTGDAGLLWTLPWTFAFSIAIVLGGAAVRIRRSTV